VRILPDRFSHIRGLSQGSFELSPAFCTVGAFIGGFMRNQKKISRLMGGQFAPENGRIAEGKSNIER
jgi:hypothetical protein